MRKLSDLFGSVLSHLAGKHASDALFQQDSGVSAYVLVGKIFIGCGFGWLLISFIPMAVNCSFMECLWMLLFAAFQIVLGVAILLLCRKSSRFQKWANADFKRGLKEKHDLEQKVIFRKHTLPFTYGDLLAFKILGVICLLLFLALIIGTLTGHVTW